MYKIGDKVSHPGHGACTVVDICEQEFTGAKKSYYVLSALVDTGTSIYVPVDRAEGIGVRELISEREADDLLEALYDMEATGWIADRNKRQKHYETLFVDNSKTSLFDSITTLNTMICRNQEKPLGDLERGVMRSIQNKALSEIALAKGISLQHAIDEAENIILGNG